MVEQKSAAAAAVGTATYLGLTLAEANEILQFIVGILSAVSLVVLILVNIKKLRAKQ